MLVFFTSMLQIFNMISSFFYKYFIFLILSVLNSSSSASKERCLFICYESVNASSEIVVQIKS